MIDDLVARTPVVIETIKQARPKDFPPRISNSILMGLQAAADRLAEDTPT